MKQLSKQLTQLYYGSLTYFFPYLPSITLFSKLVKFGNFLDWAVEFNMPLYEKLKQKQAVEITQDIIMDYLGDYWFPESQLHKRIPRSVIKVIVTELKNQCH